MSFQRGGGSRGRGGFSGGRGGRGGGGGYGGGGYGGGGGGYQQSYGPPAVVQEMGVFVHDCEGDMVCRSTNPKIPYFNAPIYLENKTQVGKVDEILGPIYQPYFTIKPQEGIVAKSFKAGHKFYIGGDKLLPLEKFLPKPKPTPTLIKPKKAGGARGGMHGARSGSFRGGPRGRGAGGPRGRGGRGGTRGGGRGGSGGFGAGSGFGRGASRGGGARGNWQGRGS